MESNLNEFIPQKESFKFVNFVDLIPQAWLELLQEFIFFGKMNKIFLHIEEKYNNSDIIISPNSINKLFTCFNMLHPDQVKIVIVGQDPYPNPSQANGIAFSANSMTSSLKTLEEVIRAQCYKNDANYLLLDTKLTLWQKQGIFLINSYLTFVQGDDSHKKESMWMDFTDEVIRKLAEKGKIIFLLMGKEAQKKQQIIAQYTSKQNSILICSHPSARAQQGQGSHPLMNQNVFSKLKVQAKQIHNIDLQLLQHK